jgi:putative phosphoribosyl transferase
MGHKNCNRFSGTKKKNHPMNKREIEINLTDVRLGANLAEPGESKALVVFAHGSGSSRLSPRNNFVADILNKRNIATLLTDLLTPDEDSIYENRFDISLLTGRLVRVSQSAMAPISFPNPIGFFGASTGAASALEAAVSLDTKISAVVSRGGRPDLAKDLSKVKAPTLLIVGSLDTQVIGLNRQAYLQLRCEKELEIVEGATHLFEEPGTLEIAANLAADWFEQHFKAADFKKS